MFNKSKKTQIVADFFLFIFASFMYFTIGYTFLKTVIDSVNSGNTGLIYYLILIVPFIPIIGLVYWGYILAQGDTLVLSDNQGGLQ